MKRPWISAPGTTSARHRARLIRTDAGKLANVAEPSVGGVRGCRRLFSTMACAARTWPLLNPARSIVGTSTAVQIPIAQLARGFRLPRTRCADELRASPKTEEKWAAFSVVTRRRLAHVGYRNRRLWTSRRLHPCADCASAPSRAPLRALWPLAVGGADRSRGALMILGSSGPNRPHRAGIRPLYECRRYARDLGRRKSRLSPQVLATNGPQNRVATDGPVFDFDKVAGGGGFVEWVISREDLSTASDGGVAAFRIVGADSGGARVRHGADEIAFAD
jgi:hypothetical protein